MRAPAAILLLLGLLGASSGALQGQQPIRLAPASGTAQDLGGLADPGGESTPWPAGSRRLLGSSLPLDSAPVPAVAAASKKKPKPKLKPVSAECQAFPRYTRYVRVQRNPELLVRRAGGGYAAVQ